MSQALPPDAAGIVFRSCRSPLDKRTAGKLLAEWGIPEAERGVASTDLFGLWDLTAPAGESLLAAAATGPLGDGGDVELRGIAMVAADEHHGLDRRLVCEVADSLRARGAARLVARPTGRAGPAPGLLRGAGFVRAAADCARTPVGARQTGAPADEEGGSWELEL
jgi:hypothetical protein